MKRITVFLFIIAAIALFSACASVNKEQAGGYAKEESAAREESTDQENNEVVENSKNNPSFELQKPNKEEILKEMMELPMEDFEAVDFEGNKVKLSDYKGKIIFLNFWATWCPPCREEMPLMQEIYNEYKDQDVIILAVNPTSVELRGGNDSEKAEKQAKEFIQDSGYTFPVLLDKEDKAWGIYQQRGIPTNYVIDKQGIIRYGFSGAFQSKIQMKSLIENIRAIE